MKDDPMARLLRNLLPIYVSAIVVIQLSSLLSAQDQVQVKFETKQLSDVYFSEGATAGDIDGDGNMDVVCGPYWYQGPEFEQQHEIYQPVPQDLERYADNFFSWVYDFDGDGNNDVFAVGFPGTPAYVYRNPGPQGEGLWEKHQVIDWVSNESPQFTNIVGDERPELVCTRDGFFGFATLNDDEPLGAWTFHPISEQIAPSRFGHGLGVGDVNGDGLHDVIFSAGWFQQPDDDATSARWHLHATRFSNSYGGAEMYAYDVDGDGDNDVITSHAAHDFGLGWYEQVAGDGPITFKHHLIMGDRPELNRYGLVFSELHSVNLVDVDGDGLKDIVTGKTYWSHHRKSPMWDADPVVYWFRLTRTEAGVDWVPMQAGNESGIGRQLSVHDINQDGHPDFIVGGMKGTYVLRQRRSRVDEATWLESLPKVYKPTGDRTDRGQPQDDQQPLQGAIEGESMKVVGVTAGDTSLQDMSGFKKDRWSGDRQLFWKGATPRARLTLEFEVPEDGQYEVGAVLTTARDYSIINLQLDGAALGSSIDLYEYPDVRTTGLLKFGTRSLDAGKHRLLLETIGANDSAIKSYMVGLDCLVLEKK
jgi:hypothetical protein